ncbi:uncharacterized protein [Montipora capricornis]|uniref:uncharacterized protein n=1 Tax=Montipora capricornis TaxID=246305 RepID=UPI0035F12D21
MDRTQKMKAFKVWNNKRTIKKFVVGINCYEDLVTKGGEKLGVSAVKAVLEEDGTEIDNEYLEFLDPNNAIILLEQQENWTDKDNCNLPVSEGHGQLHETKKTPPVVPSGAKKQATITREMRLGPPIEEVKEEPVEEEVMKDAMIYGKNLAKPLSEYQIAVNKAAGKLALQSPVLLSNRGELYEKAREQVKVDGYSFKKGFSRSNSGTSSCSSSETETVSPKVKRAKRDKDERKREVDNLTTMVENVKGNLQFKQKRLEKAKTVHDYKQCDQLATEIRQLLKDKHDYEMQIAALQKSESKSSWYFKSKSKPKKADSRAMKGLNKTQSRLPQENKISFKSSPVTAVNSGNSTCINTKSAQRGMPSSLSTSEEGEEYHTEREKSMSDESKVTSPTGSERVEPPTAIEDAPSPTDTVILQGSTDEEDVRDFALTPPVTKELEGDLNIF